MDKTTKLSFLRIFNNLKGIYKPDQNADVNYLESKAKIAEKEKFERFFKWCDANGI